MFSPLSEFKNSFNKNESTFKSNLSNIIVIAFLSFCFGPFTYSQVNDPCDVNLIEVAVVDVTNLAGQPRFDESHICSVSDTLRIEFGTPGITCMPQAVVSLNNLTITTPGNGLYPTDAIISGGVGGPWTLGTDFTFIRQNGQLYLDFNPGTQISLDQSNPLILDLIIEPGCEYVGFEGLVLNTFDLDYSLPGNIPSSTSSTSDQDLLVSIFEPFLNILNTSTTPESALPGDEVCRTLTIAQNGQFAILDTMFFSDIPDIPFGEITSFTITPFEGNTFDAPIDILPSLGNPTNIDTISLVIDGQTFGSADGVFNVGSGVVLEYCVTTQCPPQVNNSDLTVWYGCNGEICQESSTIESVVVNFNGIVDLNIDRSALIPADPCTTPLMWEFRIINDSINGGAFEILDGEADAQDVSLTLYKNDCQIFPYDDFLVSYGVGGSSNTDITNSVTFVDMGDSVVFSGMPNLGVDDTLIVKINMTLPDNETAPPACEELFSLDNGECKDPWIKVYYEDRCDVPFSAEQSQPFSASFPPLDGNPIISFGEESYTEPSYCAPGSLVLKMTNLSGLNQPSTVAGDILFYVRKDFCELFDLENYQYGSTPATGETAGLNVDGASLDSFFVVSIPTDLAQTEAVYLSFDISLGCRGDELCYFDSYECFMPNVKATWRNCYNLRWLQEYEFPYKLLDSKPDPQNSLENFGGGAGPNSLRGSGCGSRNYWYRYQFGGINTDDCRIFMRYKVAQINADGTAGTVNPASMMATGVGSSTGATTSQIIPGLGGAPDTLVIEVEMDQFESCIEEEEILVNIQFMPRCTSQTDPVLYYENYEVIMECGTEGSCCTYKRSCYENQISCFCGQGNPPPICYLFCMENTDLDLCRQTNGCPAPDPDPGFSPVPDPKEFGLACDTFNLVSRARWNRLSSSPQNPRCDTIGEITLEIDPGPYMDFCPGTADFIVYDNGVAIQNMCAGAIPFDPATNTFDLSTCVDWTNITDGDSIVFSADYKVIEEVPTCQDGFMQEAMDAIWRGKFTDGGSMNNTCGGSSTQSAEYFVGDPFVAGMTANLEFENDCQVSASVTMFDDCGVGNVFNDYRPGYILDSIVYNIQGADFTFTPGSALLQRKGENGPIDFPLSDNLVNVDNSNGIKLTFLNDGSWPEELTRTAVDDSLFCLFFDIEFTECFAFSPNIQATSQIYYNSCGGCGQKTIESPGGIEINNPPEAILNCLGPPIEIVNNDTVTWEIQVGHTPTASLHWVAFEFPSDISPFEIFDTGLNTDLTSQLINEGNGVYWLQLGNPDVNSLDVTGLYTSCDTSYVNVYTGWSCNGYPTDPITGEFSPDNSCQVIQKELIVARGEASLQSSFTFENEGEAQLCETLMYEVQVKNVGIAEAFEQVFCFYLPAGGMELIPGSVCVAYPDTVTTQPNVGSYATLSASDVTLTTQDTLVNGQLSDKYTVNLNAGILNWDLLLPGAMSPEDNTNKYRIKWEVSTDCNYISGSRVFSDANGFDRCDVEVTSAAESSVDLPIVDLNPDDFNRNQITFLDTLFGACLGLQRSTVNIVSFPAPISDDEFVCITIPTGVTLVNASPFNPAVWDMSTPTQTAIPGTGIEYCWQIPVGTPPGVFVFNLDLDFDESLECGPISFSANTKVQKESICVTTGESCTLQILTSPVTPVPTQLIPGLALLPQRTDLTLMCNEDGTFTATAGVGIQNQGTEVPPGTPVAITVFSDDNNDDIVDAGEELTLLAYNGGLAAGQIIILQETFDLTPNQVCNIKFSAGGDDCTCSSNPIVVPTVNITLSACNSVPLVCEGAQTSLLCGTFPEGDFTLSYSSSQDPDLMYINTQTGFFGPAPVGVYSYDISLNLGDGCIISGTCGMQVIGELGDFSLTGEEACPDEPTKCTIELEPLCIRTGEITNTTIGCDFRSARFFSNLTYGLTGNTTITKNGPSDPMETDMWVSDFNDSIALYRDEFARELCIVNQFGIQQEALLLPRWVNNNMVAQVDSCKLVSCTLIAIREFRPSGSVEVSIDSDCGFQIEKFEYSSYADLESQIDMWLTSTVQPIVGGSGWDVIVSSTGISLNIADIDASNTCSDTFTFTFAPDGQNEVTRIFNTDCYVSCTSGSIDLEFYLADLNGSELDGDFDFCCFDQKGSYALRTIRTNRDCRTINNQILVETAGVRSFSGDQFIDNPLNDLLLYSWDVEGGDLLSQEGNCATLSFSEPGTYEVCATPLLSPDSGLDCDIPPVCKQQVVRTDDLRADVNVIAAETCTDVSSVSIILETPEDVGSISICDEQGNIVYEDMAEGCPGISSNLMIIAGDCEFGQLCNAIPESSITAIQGIDVDGIITFTPETDACFTETGALDLIGISESNITAQCETKIGFDSNSFVWDNSSGQSISDFITDFFTQNQSNFLVDNDCSSASVEFNECGEYLNLVGLPENSLLVLSINYQPGPNEKFEQGFIVFTPKATFLPSEISEIFEPGSYTIKLTGFDCEEVAEYPFELPEPPSSEVLATITCNDLTNCSSNDGSIDFDVSTAGVVDSVVLSFNGNVIETIDSSMAVPPVFSLVGSFTDLSVGSYSITFFTQCGETTLECALSSLEDVVSIVNPEIMQYTSCAANDAEITLVAEADSPIDSIIWCGPDGMIIEDIGPHTAPYTAMTGSGILYGVWTAKVYTACAFTEESFTIVTPPPAAAVNVICDATAPENCNDPFGSIDITVEYLPPGLSPDSIVLMGSAINLVDASGSLSSSFSPLVPGTYSITVYTADACNDRTIECIIPEAMDVATITDSVIPELPCDKLFPDSISQVIINYTTDPVSPIVRVDWFMGSDVASGSLVESHFMPGSNADTLLLAPGQEGDYCAIVYAGDDGAFSSCPRDTVCFTVAATPCPPDCELLSVVENVMETLDCDEGSVFSFDIAIDGSGCVVEEGLENGGQLSLTILDSQNSVIKEVYETTMGIDNFSCTDVLPGDYSFILNYEDADGVVFCADTTLLSLTGTSQLTYTLETEIVPSPCGEENGSITVTTVTDSNGNVLDPTTFSYILYDGFTPIQTITSPNVPNFTGLKTDLYTIELIDPVSGCPIASVGAIVPNEPGNKIAPLSVLPGNNCGICDGIIIMPDSLGIIYRLQDPDGNIIFPQAPPNDNIFDGLCPGEYSVIAFDLSLPIPDECPAICDAVVPISEEGFMISLDTLTASPCEINDGRITVMAQGGFCNYTYELYDLSGNLISNTPSPDLSASLCPDLSDIMFFNNLAPGEYKVVGFATDQNGDAGACMTMDTIELRDNDIKITEADVTTEDVLCLDDANGSISVNAGLQAGETMTIVDDSGNVLATFDSSSPLPYLVNGLVAGDYQIRIDAGEGFFACTEIINVTIIEPPVLACISEFSVPSDCVTTDGAISVVPSGGTPDYSIEWSDASLSGLEVDGLAVGNYIFTITDENGCSKIDSVLLELPICFEPCPEIVPEFAVVDSECGETNGSIIVTVQEDNESYTFEWDNGSTDQELSDLASGIYCVTITSVDSPDCSIIACQEIDEIDGPVVSATEVNAGCEVDGKITLSIAEGTAPYTVEWDGPDTNDSGPVTATDGFCIEGPAGTYNIEVIDANGCANNVFVDLMQDPDLLATTSILQFPSCDMADGEIEISVLSGLFPYEFYVNDILQSTQNATVFTLANLPAGTYTYEVIDGQGCFTDGTITLLSGGGPMIDPADWIVTPPICSGQEGEISYAGSGAATLEYTLFAEGSGIPIASTTADGSLTEILPQGSYYIVCEDLTTGCTDVLDDLVIEGPEAYDFIVQYINPDCEDDIPDNGSISISIDGDYTTDELSISITNGSNTEVSDSLSASDLLPGVYTITICNIGSDQTTLCCKDRTVILEGIICSEPCPDIQAELAVVDAQCGQSNGEATVQVTTTGNYTFLWDDGSSSAMRSGLAAGIYTVTITSVERPECSVERTVEIGEIDGPIAEAVVTDATCDTANGTVEISWTSGTAPYTINWSGDASGTEANATSPYSLTVGAGSYEIEIIDANGCLDVIAVEVGEVDLLTLAEDSNIPSSCDADDGEVTLSVSGGTAPYTFMLNGISQMIGNPVTYTGLASGQYTVEVTDANGCIGSILVTIESETPPTVDPAQFLLLDADCSGDAGSISFDGTGDAAISYDLFVVGGNASIMTFAGNEATTVDLFPGEYYVVCTDANGCEGLLGDLVITAPEVLDYFVQYTDPTCPDLTDGSIEIVSITGGYVLSDLTISITDATGTEVSNTETATGLSPGDFTISVIYAGNNNAECEKVVEVNLIDPFCGVYDLALVKTIDATATPGPYAAGDPPMWKSQIISLPT